MRRLAAGVRARLRLRRSIRFLVRGTIAGAATGAILILLERAALPRVESGRVLPVALAAPLIGLAVGAVLGLRRRIADWEALALADRYAGTREVLITSVDARIDESPFGRQIVAKAEDVASRIDPRAVVSLALPAEARWAAVLIVALVLLPLLPKYVPEAVARESREKVETSKAGAEMKSDLQKIEAESPEQVPEEVKESLEKALELAAKMEQGKLDRLTSLERLGSAEDDAGRKRNELAFDRVESAFSRAAKELEKEGLASELSKALSRADAEEIEKELAELAKSLSQPSQLSDQEVDHLAEAFSRMSKALDRQGREALGQLAKEVAEQLAKGDREAAAEAMEKLASSGALDEAAKDGEASEQLAKALDAAQEAKPAVDELRKQDASGVKKALSDLAKSLTKGTSPKSFEQAQQQSLAKAMEQLAEDLKGTELEKMGEQLREAAEALKRGDAKAAAKALEKIQGERGTGECKGMARGDARLAELGRILAETRALLGQSGGEKPPKPDAPQQGNGDGKGKGPAQDYGIGTSSEDRQGSRSENEHRDRDRTGDAKSTWSEAYQEKHPSVRLEGAQGNSTFVPSRTIGAASYVEIQGLPGEAEDPKIDMAAPPADYRKAAEDALTAEEIPPGYRKQVREYFDDVPEPAPGPAAADAPAPTEPGK